MCISKAFLLQPTTNRYYKAILIVIQSTLRAQIRQLRGVTEPRVNRVVLKAALLKV